MKTVSKLFVRTAALSIAAGCVETGSTGDTSSELVSSPGMVDECVRQIRVGQPNASISTRPPVTAGRDNRIFADITVDGASWGCRIGDNGSFTAFPQFAN
ncbi:hypothetical protein ACFORG_06040 [Lutimaribacter marinistellae]|uniref:Secreted protein n=1 Tax=Lutimaribacter marinistellae TaxID=1820329 RepID=A0ABV7THN1_9RHOB